MRSVKIKWYESEYPAQLDNEEDYHPEPEEIDRGEDVVDDEWCEYEENEFWEEVAEYLLDAGVTEASGSPPWYPGIWYNTEWHKDTYTGVGTERSYHIDEGGDLSGPELAKIHQRVTRNER